MRDLTPDDIKAMIENGEREGRSLEFKEPLPGPTETAKDDFRVDVAAMANAAGGRLLYGIAEKRGTSGEPTSVAGGAPGIADENVGQAIQRLEQILKGGIEPRVPGCRFYTVAGVETNPVLVLDVPKSWLAPHMVCRDGRQLFYSRCESGNYRLDYREIRAAFLASEGVMTKMRGFLDGRLGLVVAEATPVPLLRGPRLVLHLVPARTFADPELFSPELILDARDDFRPGEYAYSRDDYRLNLDGVLLLRPPAPDGHRTYVQVFRTGVVESVIADLGEVTAEGVSYIRPVWLEGEVRKLLSRQFKGLEKLGVQAPVALVGALLGARGFRLFCPGEDEEQFGPPIDRDVAAFPEELLETLPASADEPVRRMFDALLLAGGYLRT